MFVCELREKSARAWDSRNASKHTFNNIWCEIGYYFVI